MSQVNVNLDNAFVSTVTYFPPGTKFYQYALADVPGVVAANNFFSLLNPVGSTKTITPIQTICQSYCTTNTTASGSMVIKRITAHSGGTLIAASSINRPDITQSDPVAEVRSSNPTVTLNATFPIPFDAIAPIISTGGGNVTASFVAPPAGLSVVTAGNGFVFSTPSGATSQFWNLRFVWGEY